MSSPFEDKLLLMLLTNNFLDKGDRTLNVLGGSLDISSMGTLLNVSVVFKLVTLLGALGVSDQTTFLSMLDISGLASFTDNGGLIAKRRCGGA